MTENRGDTIIFDLDGTLFQTEKVAVPAFQRTFRRLLEKGLYRGESPSNEQIQSVFGMTLSDIWERLLPGASEEAKRKADDWWLQDELDCLAEGMGTLYPEVSEGMEELSSRGWQMWIASNGLGPYVRGVVDTFGLADRLKGIYTAGEQQIAEKDQLVKRLMKQNGISSGWMVGDRRSDIHAGKVNGLTVIGCRYPDFPRFGDRGELEGADRIIDHFHQLLDVVGYPAGK